MITKLSSESMLDCKSQNITSNSGKALLFPLLFIASVCALGATSLQTADAVAKYVSYGLNLTFTNNLREVAPNRLYRSGKMRLEQVEPLIKKLGIKSIIDLRLGNKASDQNGRTEKSIATALGVNYYHIGFRSTRVSPYVRVRKLLDAIDQAPTPLWIHCSNGTHRSGFASMLWLLRKEVTDFESAKIQLHENYGLLRIERVFNELKSGHPTQDSVVWKYEREDASKRKPFISWLLDEIRDVKPKYPSS